MTERVKIKCDDCKFVDDCVDYGWEGCKKFTQKQPHTNEEWFNNLSTEEKAEWLDGLIAYCFGVGHITETERKKYQYIVADVEMWLKQPHREVIDKWWERNEDKPC